MPRSGSTVLSAVLKQNPRFYAGMTTNLFNILKMVTQNSDIETGIQRMTYEQSRNVFTKIIEGYHLDKPQEIIFDTNRGWVGFSGLLKNLMPETKIICCVRDIPSILNSYETHYQNKCIVTPSYFSPNKDVVDNPYSRAHSLFETQIISLYDNCQFYFQNDLYRDFLIFVDYDELILNPKSCIKNLYNRLGQDYFEHDFTNLDISFENIDSVYNNHELHKVNGKLERKNIRWVIPNNIRELYARPLFWKS